VLAGIHSNFTGALQACDYLVDEEAVETICSYLGERLFETCSHNLQYRRISGTNDEPSAVRDFHEVLFLTVL
jgi:hypothetical protein